MKIKKLNVIWNNTDWSVSDFKIRAINPDPQISAINHNTTLPAEKITPASAVNQLRNDSLETQSDEVRPGLPHALESARLEAAALAWSTGFPFLVLPCLREELETAAANYSSKQTQVQQRSVSLLNKTFPIATRRLAA